VSSRPARAVSAPPVALLPELGELRLQRLAKHRELLEIALPLRARVRRQPGELAAYGRHSFRGRLERFLDALDELPVLERAQPCVDLGLGFAPIADGVAPVEPAALGLEVSGFGDHLLTLTARDFVLCRHCNLLG